MHVARNIDEVGRCRDNAFLKKKLITADRVRIPNLDTVLSQETLEKLKRNTLPIWGKSYEAKPSQVRPRQAK